MARNILFLMADQLAARFVGAYGSGVDSTPTLDALARRGMRFDACYATWPICAPNRASILTGRSPVVHGVTRNNLVLTGDHPTWASVLRRCGYRVGGFGKFHVTPMQQPPPESLEHLGFDEVAVTEDPRLGPWLDWIAEERPDAYEAALATVWQPPYIARYGPDGRDLRPARAAAREKHLHHRKRDSGWGHAYASPVPAELSQTTFITDRAMDFMARHLQGAPDRPFLCHVSYVDPHDPYDPPEPYDGLFDPADMPPPLPPAWQADPSHPRRLWERASQFGIDALEPGAVARARAMYHGSIRHVDDQIARLVAFLDDRGLWDSTIVVFTTDHGDMMFDHGLITKGSKHFDAGIRCPLIVAGAGVAPGAADDLACGLDLLPTLLDFAAVPDDRRPPHEGRSLAPLCLGEPHPDPWPEVAVDAGRVRSIVTDDGWRLTLFDEPGGEQMHDLRADPDEQRNLFADAAHAARRHELLLRHARAFMRPAQTLQFPNLPVRDGRRCADLDGISRLDGPLDLPLA